MDYSKLYEYFIVLFYKYNYKNISMLDKKDYDLESIYKYIYELWKEYSDEVLDLNKEEDKEKLYDLLNEIFRYELLNDCIEELYDNLTEQRKDEFIINNLSHICETIELIFKNNSSCEVDLSNLPKLSSEDLDMYFKEFLVYIDDSLEYLECYEKMKKDKKIVFFDLLSDKQKKYFKKLLDIKDDDYNTFTMKDKGFIVIDRKGDISDLRTLTHEFIHYYIYKNSDGKEPYYLLQEFPSIIYEYFANKFLIMKSINKEDVKKLFLFRFNEIDSKKIYLKTINKYLKMYNDNNCCVTLEDDMDQIKNIINDFIDKNGIDEYRKRVKENKIDDPKLIAKDYCDEANFYLVRFPYDLVQNYPYLIGQYLSIHYIEEMTNNKFSLKELKEMTKNISDINPQIIFDVENKEKIKKKID